MLVGNDYVVSRKQFSGDCCMTQVKTITSGQSQQMKTMQLTDQNLKQKNTKKVTRMGKMVEI